MKLENSRIKKLGIGVNVVTYDQPAKEVKDLKSDRSYSKREKVQEVRE